MMYRSSRVRTGIAVSSNSESSVDEALVCVSALWAEAQRGRRAGGAAFEFAGWAVGRFLAAECQWHGVGC